MIPKGPKLKTEQWKVLAGASSNISQAIILFSLAAIFAPEAVNISNFFSPIKALIFLFWGFFLLTGAAIMSTKGKK